MYSTSIDDESEKNRSLCSCLGCFMIWLFPVCLAIGVALFFSPNDRISSIEEYNKRATMWRDEGYNTFFDSKFSLIVKHETMSFERQFVEAKETVPTGDNCNMEGDPEEGCVRTRFFYDTVKFYYPVESESIKFDIMYDGKIIINETVAISTSQGRLQSLCFRVRDEDDSYVLDSPAAWPLHMNEGEVGCEFSNSWEPLRYGKAESTGKAPSIEFRIRYYMDPSIAASSLTRGCSDNEGASNCFGITKKAMTSYGLYIIIGAGSVTLLEIIVLLSMCCCCRGKLPCFEKEK